MSRTGVRVGLAVLLVVATAVAVRPAGAQETGSEPPGADPPAVIDGSPVPAGEHPYVVSMVADPLRILFGGDLRAAHLCAGTLVSPTLVMTSADCVDEGTPPSYLGVLSGRTNLAGGVGAGGQYQLATRIGLHPGWDQDPGDDNIAFVRVPSPVAATPVVPARPAQAARWAPGTTATILGWGSTEPVFWNEPTALQAGEVGVVSDATCNSPAPNGWDGLLDPDLNVCAGLGGFNDEGLCHGDSGAPLLVPDGSGGLIQAGIGDLSTRSCGLSTLPDFYAEVATYHRFVDASIAAPVFTDVDLGHPFLTEIWAMRESGAIGGFPDGSFRPAASVTRQAMAAFMYRLSGEPPFAAPAVPSLPDVATDHPFYEEIEWLVAEGITTGYADGRYRPAGAVTRIAMAAFMFRLAGVEGYTPPASPSFVDVPTSSPFYAQIEWLVANGITNGYAGGRYRPELNISRQAMAAFMDRLVPLLG